MAGKPSPHRPSISRLTSQLDPIQLPGDTAGTLAVVVGASLDGATLATLREKMIATQQRAASVLANLHLQHLPTRNEICGRAMAMFAKTSSIDDIVDMAHMLILDAIGARLLLPQNRTMSTS
jgi:hypothetical protein